MRTLRKPAELHAGRMPRLSRLPVFYSLDSKRVIIAGGTAAAAWKAELLSAAGAAVHVYSEKASAELIAVVAEPPCGPVAIHHRSWESGDFHGAVLAIGAFDDDAETACFAAAARAAGVPVNIVDKPALCDFTFGAIVNRSPLVVGISTDGAAPVFAQAIRARIEAMLPTRFACWAGAAARWRTRVKASGFSFAGRRRFWQLFTAHALGNMNRPPAESDLDGLLAQVRNDRRAVENGSVTLVGAGPGDPELLTLRAVRALQGAEVILFDDLVAPEVLDFARREARKLLVGKTGHGASCRQEEINALMVTFARAGRRVVRLKGGDPLVFGRAGEEIAACREANIPIEVVPGISASQGAAARLGVSLTHRSFARRLQYISGHGADGRLPSDIDWSALADPTTTTVVYMPRLTLAELAKTAIARGLDASMPAAAVIRGTQPDEAVISATIAELPKLLAQEAAPGPVVVIIGRVIAGIDNFVDFGLCSSIQMRSSRQATR